MAVTEASTDAVTRIDVTEVLDAPRAGNDLVVTPHPLTTTGQVVLRGVMLARGDTLASLLARHGVRADEAGWQVRVGGMEVPALLWARTRAKPGMLIEAHRVAGKDAVRLIALVALAWFTMGSGLMAAGAGQVGGLGGWLGFNGFTAYAINAGAFMLCSMVINKLLPPSKAGGYGGATPGTTYSLQGARNRARHFEPLGLLMGQVRVAPDFAAQPFAWFEGDDQYQYIQLHAGLNVGTVDQLKIGATDIATYSGVTVTRTGFATGNTDMLAWESVDTVAGALLDAVTAPGAWVERNSSVNTLQLQVDIVGQLYFINKNGNPEPFICEVAMEYRLLPSGSWLPFVGSSSTVQLSSSTTKPLRRTFSRAVSAGQYAVRMRKLEANETRQQAANTIEWAALKSYQADGTATVAKQLVGIKIKASGQLNGVLDQVTWLATSAPCPVWTGSAWVTQATSNPGALYLQFCRGVFAADGRLLWGVGKPDDQIDIEGLKAWMVHCAAQGYRFDHWWDATVARGDVLDAIAAAGLAARSYHTGKLGVVYMASGQAIEAVVGMGNIKRGSMRVGYATRVTAEELEVASPERTNDWLPATLRVLAPGVTVPRETARVSPPGITTQAGRLLAARMAMAQNIYGRKSVTWDMDLEHLTFRRWSLVALSHDLTQWGHSGRLQGVATNLLAWSEDMRNTAEAGSTRPWLQFNDAGDNVATVLLTPAALPDGVAQCTKLQSTGAGNETRLIYQLVSSTADGQDVVLEVRAAAAECSYLQLAVRTRDSLMIGGRFDLASGVVSGVDSSGAAVPTVQIEPTDAAGWWLCRVRVNLRTGTDLPYVSMRLQAAGNVNFTATGAGQGLLLAGAMLSPGAAAPAVYVRTTSAGAMGIGLDAEVPAGGSGYVGLRLPGEQAYRVLGVAARSDAGHALTLTDAWPAGATVPGSSADNPPMDTLWIFDFNATPGLRLRVVDIKPTANLTGATITAVPEPDGFWTYMASGAYTVPATAATATPVVLSNLQVTQQRLALSYDLTAELDITFDATGPFDHAQVWGAVGGDPLQPLGTTRTRRFAGWRVVNAGTVTV
ncbi:MAG: TipJ family phage tail tip protein, partial [Hydrogenophaga sp.]|uniref:TipJ family phage tail tip protein n=1 Tax=Hydrogenophaga sp. TaxID=1904254 RepID=UPI003D9AFA5C